MKTSEVSLYNLQIEVLLPNKLVRKGNLEHYSLHYNVALVSVEDCRVVRPAKIQLDCVDISRVAAAGRCFRSGTIMATSGRLVSWSGRLDCKFILRSTCKISKVGTAVAVCCLLFTWWKLIVASKLVDYHDVCLD